jgi:hypothetical protein
MKYVKALVLTAMAVMALMAFIGASSASATVFCKTQPTTGGSTQGTTCPEGWAYPGGTRNHEVAVEKVTMGTEFETIECNESTIHGEIEKEGGATETPKGPVDGLTFTGSCNCSISVLKKGTQEFHWIPDTFNVTIISNGAETTATCNTIFGTVHCIYVTENTDLGEITASENSKAAAVTHINAEMPSRTTSALCGEESHWIGKYEVKEPIPLYFAAHT